MSGGKRVRALPWLQARSSAVWQSEYRDRLVSIAKAKFPTGAAEAARQEVFLGTGDAKLADELALACRWLAVIKRDHGEAVFDWVVSTVSSTSQVPRLISTGTKGKDPMSTLQSSPKQEALAVATERRMPELPLQHLAYRASVCGVFARVRCVQKFANDAAEPIEAVYCFPMPDDASVIACTMVLGERRVEAQLKEKERARQEYDDAVAAGHHGALLEQERSNIFTMNVGGLEPGERIEVEVDYVQRVQWQAGGGRFTIPLVVAPRFIPGVPTDASRRGAGWSPDTDQVPDASRITPVVAKAGVPYHADISVLFAPGFTCWLQSPSHGALVEGRGVAHDERVVLQTGDIVCDRDFVLAYASTAHVPEVAVHRGVFGQEQFVQATILPPGTVPVQASDIVMVLDCSGSMHGAKIEGLRRIAKKVVQLLSAQPVAHRLGIVPFDDKPWPALPLSAIREAGADQFIDQLEDRGGTELGLALTAAYQLCSDASRPRVILLVTDGQTEALRFQGSGVRIVAVGIDTAVNDTAIKDLAARSGGVCEFVYPGEDYDSVAHRLVGCLSGPVLRDVTVSAGAGEVVGVGDVFAGRPAVVTVRFAGEVEPVAITGKDPSGQAVTWTVALAQAAESDFAAQVWARDYIREHTEVQAQTRVSLTYGVICQHTSFVAVSLKEVPGKQPVRVEIPVNLPAGWDYDAVFGQAIFRAACVRTRASRLTLAAANLLPPRDDVEVNFTEVFESYYDPLGVSDRFTLPSGDAVDRLVAVLINVGSDYQAAAAVFADIQRELTVEAVAALSEAERARAYYFAARLTSYGLTLAAEVMQALRARPQGEVALAWYNLARKEEGLGYAVAAAVSGDGSEYIAWKFGGEKPFAGEWSLVP